MPNRKIYTTSEVLLSYPQTSGGPGGVLTPVAHSDGNYLVIPAVTSATFTRDTPREQVSVFGKKGQVDTVRNESTTSTIEVVFHPPSSSTGMEGPEPSGDASEANVGDWFGTTMLAALMLDSSKPNPGFSQIQVRGVGSLTWALLTSITAEGSVGALPTITLGFDGTGVLDTTGVGGANTASFVIATMTDVALAAAKAAESGNLAGNLTSFAQSATFNWEMPTEKVNKLGASVDSAYTYGTPPGTSSISVEGIDNAGRITGATFGLYEFLMDEDSKISNTTNNMAVGEIGATYNVTIEGTADGCTVS